MQETWVSFLDQEDLEKEVATHSSILAWEIPWTEEPGGFSPWGCKELDMTEQLSANTHTHTHTQEVRSSSETVNKVTSSSAAGGRYSASTCQK